MTKQCSVCSKDLETSEFFRRSKSPDGLQAHCKKCSAHLSVEARVIREKTDPGRDKRLKQAWYQKNRELSIERAKQYRIDNPDWAKEMNAKHRPAWRKRYPEKAKELGRKQAFTRKLRKYGLTPEKFQAMIEKQEGKCAVCGIVPPDSLVIDHDHITGRLRELLCNPHNVALGMIQDDPEIARKLILYLEKHN